jgi:hypothetical protein
MRSVSVTASSRRRFPISSRCAATPRTSSPVPEVSVLMARPRC